MASPAPLSTPQQISPAAMARLCERAIKENNHPKAMEDLAYMLLYNKGIKLDPPRGIQLLERAIKQAGSPRAMWFLGCYFYRKGNRSQRRRAISLLERAATLTDHPSVWCSLASALASPRCSVKRQPLRAVQLLRRALRVGEHTDCMWLLASLLVSEPEVPPDTVYAMSLFTRVIEITNNADQMYDLGIYFTRGATHIPPDPRRAFKWFARAILATDHTDAKFQLAVTLISNPDSIPPNPSLAKVLLEDVLRIVTKEDAVYRLIDVLCSWEETRDFGFAASLCDFAVRKFDSVDRMYQLAIILSTNYPNMPGSVPYALSLYTSRCDRISCVISLVRRIEILSYGAMGVPANRDLARELLTLLQSCDHGGDFLATVLRCGVPGVIEADRTCGYELLRACADPNYSKTTQIYAMFISEESDKSGVRTNYEEAVSLFRTRYELRKVTGFYWTPLSLRLCTVPLPIQGEPSTFTLTVKRYDMVDELAGLNLAGLLLEGHGTSPLEVNQALAILTALLDKRIGDLAAINLGYLRWHGMAGVMEDRALAVELYERAFRTRPGALAGALLADALTDETDGMVADVERAVKLWRWVRFACEREGAELNEFERVCSFISEEGLKFLEEAIERNDIEDEDVVDIVHEEETHVHLGVDDVVEILRLHSSDDA